MRITLIVAAGGSGSRFNKGLNQKRTELRRPGARVQPTKLFYALQGRPVLAETLAKFQGIAEIKEVLVAVSRNVRAQARMLVPVAGFRTVKLVPGGRTRAESVWNALRKSSPRNEWVMVHDGARPLITGRAIRKLIRSVRQSGGVLLAKKVVPTIKEIGARDKVRRTVDRKFLAEAETPQMVRRTLLLKAYRENPRAFEATDEAALLESIGKDVQAVFHEDWNPKITSVQDLEQAERFLMPQTRTRIGRGSDLHRLVEGRKFYLGGVEIPYPKGPLGHSDGDVLLHALTDAVLGVLGKGDIGDWFSDRDPRYKNIRSEKMLREVLVDAARNHWTVDYADSVIYLEEPKLGAYKKKIQERVAGILGVGPEAVSVKAKTMEKLGPVGEGLAVSCEVLVGMKKQESQLS